MLLEVIVHPQSRLPRVEKRGVQYHVYVREKPIDGRANQAARVLLAGEFRVAKTQIELVGGVRSRKKIFKITEHS